MAWEPLKTDYTDASWDGLKRYSQIDNEDGTVSFQDVTVYTGKEKSFFGAKDANAMNGAINEIMETMGSADEKQNLWCVPTTGTSSAYIATLNPAPDSLYVGMHITIIPHITSSTSGATLNVNGFGAKLFRHRGSATDTLYSPSTYRFLAQGKPVSLLYDGTYWIITEYSKPIWNDVKGAPDFLEASGVVAGDNIKVETSGGTVTISAPDGGEKGSAVYRETGTWYCPPGVTKVTVIAIGAGGGGGSRNGPDFTKGGGGGGGGNIRLYENVSVTPGTTYDVVVGAGGSGGNSSSQNGKSGGTSYFRSTSYGATGGTGGAVGTSSAIGAGGNG